MMTEDRLARIMARHAISRRHLLLVTLFARAHPDLTIARALFDFVRGVGPAAVAAGRVRDRVRESEARAA